MSDDKIPSLLRIAKGLIHLRLLSEAEEVKKGLAQPIQRTKEQYQEMEEKYYKLVALKMLNKMATKHLLELGLKQDEKGFSVP